MDATEQVTQLLLDWSAGDKAALDKLVPFVHDELRRLARNYMRRERAGHTLQTTALINEGYLRLVDGEVAPKLAVAPLEGGQPVKLFDISQEESVFCWTPDGRALAYIDDRSLNVWSQPLDGGKPVQLTDFKTDQTFFFDWSRDGKQLALARGSRTSDVVMISGFK